MVVVVLFCGLAAFGLARLAAAGVARSQAQQAADAAALAGARFDQAEAQRLSSLNGAAMVSYSEQVLGAARLVTVEVVLDDVSALASARWDPPPPPTPPPTEPSTTTTTTTTEPLDPQEPNNTGTAVEQ